LPSVFIATEEQLALARLCAAEADKFTAQPALHGSESAIARARSLLQQAVDAGLPGQAWIGLQIVVSIHETDMELPEHLRRFKKLP
jgi:hypothetical protein